MLSVKENELLCLVENERPMGRLISQCWIPAIDGRRLERDGAPQRVRLLGGSYVAFRDSDGELGFLDEKCPHRGASLALARNENCALQCLYHGWRIDREGVVVEAPSEPEDSTFKDRVRHKSYSVVETGGVVWVYLGPAGSKPTEPEFGFTGLDDSQHYVIRAVTECNWVQALEGVIDTAHIMFLHSDVTRPDWFGQGERKQDERAGAAAITASSAASRDGHPKLVIEDTSYGYRYAGLRAGAGDSGERFVRASHYVSPFVGMFPAAEGWGFMQAFVPIDDYNTMFYFWFWRTDGQTISQEERDGFLEYGGFVPGKDVDELGRGVLNVHNWWQQDRDAMRRGASFTGIRGVNREDFAVQESMGPLYDRSREHLGTSDVAVIRMRRIMLDAVKMLDAGEPVSLGLSSPISYRSMRGSEGVIRADEPWQTISDGEAEPIPGAERSAVGA